MFAIPVTWLRNWLPKFPCWYASSIKRQWGVRDSIEMYVPPTRGCTTCIPRDRILNVACARTYARRTRTYGQCLLHRTRVYMHLVVHHRGTHGRHVPTITMDTAICTPSYRKIKVVGSRVGVCPIPTSQFPSPVRYTRFKPFAVRENVADCNCNSC